MKTAEDIRREFEALARVYAECMKDETASTRRIRYEVTEGEAALMHKWAPTGVPLPVAGDRFEFFGVPCIVVRRESTGGSDA